MGNEFGQLLVDVQEQIKDRRHAHLRHLAMSTSVLHMLGSFEHLHLRLARRNARSDLIKIYGEGQPSPAIMAQPASPASPASWLGSPRLGCLPALRCLPALLPCSDAQAFLAYRQ